MYSYDVCFTAWAVAHLLRGGKEKEIKNRNKKKVQVLIS